MTQREVPEFPFGETPKLLISYDPDTDTLDLSNGKPTSVGTEMVQGVTVSFEEMEERYAPRSIAIEGAAAALLEILQTRADVRLHPAGQPLPS